MISNKKWKIFFLAMLVCTFVAVSSSAFAQSIVTVKVINRDCSGENAGSLSTPLFYSTSWAATLAYSLGSRGSSSQDINFGYYPDARPVDVRYIDPFEQAWWASGTVPRCFTGQTVGSNFPMDRPVNSIQVTGVPSNTSYQIRFGRSSQSLGTSPYSACFDFSKDVWGPNYLFPVIYMGDSNKYSMFIVSGSNVAEFPMGLYGMYQMIGCYTIGWSEIPFGFNPFTRTRSAGATKDVLKATKPVQKVTGHVDLKVVEPEADSTIAPTSGKVDNKTDAKKTGKSNQNRKSDRAERRERSRR